MVPFCLLKTSRNAWYMMGTRCLSEAYSAASSSSKGLTFSEELAAQAKHSSRSMMPEHMIDWGCEEGSRAIKVSADARTKEIGILATAAHNSAEGEGSGESEAFGEPAVAGDEEKSLSWGVVIEIAGRGVSTGRGLRLADWNVTAWVIQSIDGLCRYNHEYPRTAWAEQSNVVKRNRTGCCAPQGKVMRRLVN